MLLTFIGLVIFSVGFVFSGPNTKYHILCSGVLEQLGFIPLIKKTKKGKHDN